jgi:hypothetical protein
LADKHLDEYIEGLKPQVTVCKYPEGYDISGGNIVDTFVSHDAANALYEYIRAERGDPSWWISHPGWTYAVPCTTTSNGPNEDRTESLSFGDYPGEVRIGDTVAAWADALRKLANQ